MQLWDGESHAFQAWKEDVRYLYLLLSLRLGICFKVPCKASLQTGVRVFELQTQTQTSGRTQNVFIHFFVVSCGRQSVSLRAVPLWFMMVEGKQPRTKSNRRLISTLADLLTPRSDDGVSREEKPKQSSRPKVTTRPIFTSVLGLMTSMYAAFLYVF
jgi:hypothetical protein